jgi:TonB family protein
MTVVLASGSELAPPCSDLESEVRATQLTVLWSPAGAGQAADEGVSVLEVVHLRGPCTYSVTGSILGACALSLGVRRTGEVELVLPEDAQGHVCVDGVTRTLEALAARPAASVSAEGAIALRLPRDATAAITIGSLTFLLEPTHEGRRIGPAAWLRAEREAWTTASLAFHAAILLVFFLMPPRPPSLTPELLPAETSRLLRSEIVLEADLWFPNEPFGGTGTRHEGTSGAMGAPSSAASSHRYAIEGRARSRQARLAATSSREAVSTAGALGVLARMSDAWTPSSPYASSAVGADPVSALGALMGDHVGDSFGVGGLGLHGTGRGAGGSGRGTVGLGTLGTLGHGAGTGPLQGFGSGYGSGAGGFRGRTSRVPRTCSPGCRLDVRGGLSREVVRRVVRRHANEVRFCYEQGLERRGDLAGRVAVTFVIAETGRVQSSTVGSSTLGSAEVEACVASAVRRWSFPETDGGPVLVTYPFVFDAPT